MRPWHRWDWTATACRGTGRRQVPVLAPQHEAATLVVSPEEMDREHSLDCTGGAPVS